MSQDIKWDWVDKYAVKLLKQSAGHVHALDPRVTALLLEDKPVVSQIMRLEMLQCIRIMLASCEHSWIKQRLSDLVAMCKNAIEVCLLRVYAS